jgi:hypothetical protein
MIAFIGGSVFALFLHYITGLTWVLVIAFWVCALPLQVSYTHRLNAFLGGADPVATFGARNFSQLKGTISVPFSITVLYLLAKAMAWAGLVAFLFSVGWLKTDTL